ncbi:methyltransferase domain-containing protein [Candidatus Bipolaricaulota bacterium]|nr:methyltransferase domain-containing protein [Candidatus Bipolaricaulota bacterium]
MHSYLLGMLECPACHGDLSWSIAQQRRDRILDGSAVCRDCGADYPIRDGIGIFLTPDLPRNDLWEVGSRQLTSWLAEHPDVETRLMEPPPTELGPADLFFRGLTHEERREFDAAEQAFETARLGFYTEEYLACSRAQSEFLIEELKAGNGPIVDLASGRCSLVKKLAKALDRPIIATDFSPTVLRRDRDWLIRNGLYENVSLLAFDARRTPFRDESINTMTTNMGLPNIESPGDLLTELRRVVSGRLLAVSCFYPPDDEANLAPMREHGLDRSMVREPALEDLADAGWQAIVRNSMHGLARPTPASVIIEGWGIDAFPVAETTLEWCGLDAQWRALRPGACREPVDAPGVVV